MSLLTPPVPAARSSRIGRMPNGESMCAAICRPSCRPMVQRVGRFPQVHLASHDHVDELLVRREPLLLDAEGVLRILVSGYPTGALEVAERGPAARVEQGLDGGVRVLGRVMDLRDVVHRRDSVVELGQAAEQLVDVHVLRPVHGRELLENEFEIRRIGTRGARLIVDEDAVGEEAAQRGLELMVVRVYEARHHDAAPRVDDAGAGPRFQVRPHVDDLAPLDKDVAGGEVANLRVERHDVPTANDIAAAVPAVVGGRVGPAVGPGRRRREEVHPHGGRRRRRFQKIAPRAAG
jgi:hypothetical protein